VKTLENYVKPEEDKIFNFEDFESELDSPDIKILEKCSSNRRTKYRRIISVKEKIKSPKFIDSYKVFSINSGRCCLKKIKNLIQKEKTSQKKQTTKLIFENKKIKTKLKIENILDFKLLLEAFNIKDCGILNSKLSNCTQIKKDDYFELAKDKLNIMNELLLSLDLKNIKSKNIYKIEEPKYPPFFQTKISENLITNYSGKLETKTKSYHDNLSFRLHDLNTNHKPLNNDSSSDENSSDSEDK